MGVGQTPPENLHASSLNVFIERNRGLRSTLHPATEVVPVSSGDFIKQVRCRTGTKNFVREDIPFLNQVDQVFTNTNRVLLVMESVRIEITVVEQ